MSRLGSLAAMVAASALLSACLSSGARPSPSAPASGGAAPTVLPVIVSREIGVGPNRILFSFLDAAGNAPVAAPDRSASVRFTGPGGESVGPVEGRFIWAIERDRGLYAATADFPSAGAWTAEFRTSAPGSPTEVIPFSFDVLADTSVLRPGEKAPSVDTPTADDVDGDLARLSTDPEPMARLYDTSESDALASGDPFVLAFATPKFCATAQCGPTLDRVKEVAESHPDVTFINVEPYQLELRDGQLQPVLDADGQLQPVPAVGAFGLLSEPFIFVVDGTGTITASFEAVFDEGELEEALADLG